MSTQHAATLVGQLRSVPKTPQSRDSLACRVNSRLDFPSLLHRFESISLAQMDEVALLDRVDTKYVLRESELYHALASLAEQYRVLDIEGTRLNRYQSLYFDTADFALYMCHHNGAENRFKVRSRRYVDSDRSFLEVKLKTNTGRTIKSRVRTPGMVTRLASETRDYVNAHVKPNTRPLEPKLWNDFARVTLVNKDHRERLTLDLNLRFRYDGRIVALPGIIIAEVKRQGRSHTSEFMRLMRERHFRSTAFSKYCIGVSLLYPDVKHNNFKAKQRLLARLMRGDGDDTQ